MPGPVFRRGDEVTLHPVEREDLAFLQRNRNDPAVRYGLTLSDPQNAHQAETAFERHAEDDGGEGFLVCVPADGAAADAAPVDGAGPDASEGADADFRPVGHVVVFDIDETVGRGELACWITPAEHGRGYATEATALLVDYAFRERRFHKVLAHALVTNAGSRTVLSERLGMVEEGRHRDEKYVNGEHVDVVRYSLLEDEWTGLPG